MSLWHWVCPVVVMIGHLLHVLRGPHVDLFAKTGERQEELWWVLLDARNAYLVCDFTLSAESEAVSMRRWDGWVLVSAGFKRFLTTLGKRRLWCKLQWRAALLYITSNLEKEVMLEPPQCNPPMTSTGKLLSLRYLDYYSQQLLPYSIP